MSATGITFTGLSEYVNVHKDELIVKSSLGAKTLDFVEVMPNVKYEDELLYLDSNVTFADGSVCGWNPDGSDVISKRTIKAVPVKIEKQFCAEDFRKYAGNYQLRTQAGLETLPYEEKIMESNANAVKDALEDLLWKGSGSLGITGITASISAETAAQKVSLATGSTISAAINAVVAAIPAKALKKGVNVFMSYTSWREYVAEQNSSCCQTRPIIDAAAENVKFVGDSRINLVPVYGLEKAATGDSAYFVAATADAIVYATDIEGAENAFDFWYEKSDDEFRLRVKFNAGVAIKFPDETVLAELPVA